MSRSLRDQLLKAGVASKQQAQNIASEKRKKKKRKGSVVAVEEGKDKARRVQMDKAARDRELNRQKEDQTRRKAVAAQIRQLIETKRLSRDGGELEYSFVDGTLVRKIYVTEAMATELADNRLAIARFDGGYEIVPDAVASKISQRDRSVIVAPSPAQAPVDEDDPYADYQVPDDLRW